MTEKDDIKTVIRKLSPSELFFDENVSICDNLNSRAFFIRTKIDIYSRKDLLDKAISSWKDAHPLLRCHIVRDNHGDKCFAYAPVDIVESQENLIFLYFESEEIVNNNEDVWKMFLEKELSTPLDSSRLSWRLILIQVNINVSNEYFYYLIFTTSHAIFDGRNIVKILCQLFSFLERLHLDKKIEFETYEPLPAMESLAKINLNSSQFSNLFNDKSNNICSLKLPESFSTSNYKPFSVYNPDKEGIFYYVNKKIFSTYREMVEENKNHFTAIQKISLEQNITQKLLEKCKQHQTKLTGCLHMITILATQQIFKNFAEENIENVRYSTAVDMRPLLNPPIDTFIKMGTFAIGFDSNFNSFINEIDKPNFWSQNFWSYAKLESDTLHSRIFRKEHFSIVDDLSTMKQSENLIDLRFKQFQYHFKFSNRGDMSGLIKTENQFIEFLESFTGMSYTENNKSRIFTHFVETIDKNLFWSWTYNKNIIRAEIADFYHKFIKDAVKKLVLN